LNAAKDFEKTYDLISCHMRNLGSTDFSAGLFIGIFVDIPVDLFTRMVHEWFTEENINDCRCPPLAIAAQKFGESLPFQCPHWKSIILHLIRLGSDLQRGSREGTTILDDLMNVVNTPFESQSLGLAWLDILTELRLDVVEYLRTEYRFHFDPSKSLPILSADWRTDYRARRLVVSEETPSISWDWFIDANGKAFEVLEEFKNFGPGAVDDIDWFVHGPRSLNNWPFFYPIWDFYGTRARFIPWYEITPAKVQLAEDRFERRWQKKAMKLARAQGILQRGPKVPGAWID
jgi:hypothetical protein